MISYDQLMELIRERRSIRRFDGRAVGREELHRLLEAARWAPSNHNRQPWKFIVIEDRGRIRALAGHVRQGMASKLQALPAIAAGYAAGLVEHGSFFAAAPVVIVALHKLPIAASAALWESTPQPALVSGEPLSVAMAIQNLLLAAHALGLGACVMTAPLLADGLTEWLELPPGYGITGMIAVGYAAAMPAAPRRKQLGHISEFNDL